MGRKITHIILCLCGVKMGRRSKRDASLPEKLQEMGDLDMNLLLELLLQ